MRTYSGEYAIADGEWCAIAFYREKSKNPAAIADVSVVLLDARSTGSPMTNL